jgi:hypothetical protein
MQTESAHVARLILASKFFGGVPEPCDPVGVVQYDVVQPGVGSNQASFEPVTSLNSQINPSGWPSYEEGCGAIEPVICKATKLPSLLGGSIGESAPFKEIFRSLTQGNSSPYRAKAKLM